jgi:DNA modification methylase
MTVKELYYGDNLQVMREQIPGEHVDLIYLDPPFNSARDYNLLFKTPTGEPANAQIEAFQDTWHWGEQAEAEFDDILRQPNTQVASMISAILGFLGRNDMTAYLVMMASRLLELRRILKSTGSLYLHCDPTASHYLKIVLDAVFGHQNFRNEIIWKRTNAHNFKSRQFARAHDVILFYSMSDSYTYNKLFGDFSPQQLKRYYLEQETGRLVTGQDMTILGGDMTPWRGTTPNGKRGWGLSLEERERLWDAGLVLTRKDGSPRLDGRKVYLDEKKGVPIDDIWNDISRIANTSSERLGYPTQKPVELLERIILVSSNEGDIVLDPFCGCGAAIHAAENLSRQWIGIDITHLAISLIEKRLYDAFPGLKCVVHGTPKDLDSARDLAERDKYQFQWWACSLVNAQPFGGQKKGADGGIDGLIFFRDDSRGTPQKIIVSVKGGANVSVSMVRDLRAVIEREKAAIGLFVCLAQPTQPMITEAVGAGFYESPNGRRYPRIQVLPIEDLFSGVKPNYPDFTQGQATFKKAPVARKKQDNKTLWE